MTMDWLRAWTLIAVSSGSLVACGDPPSDDGGGSSGSTSGGSSTGGGSEEPPNPTADPSEGGVDTSGGMEGGSSSEGGSSEGPADSTDDGDTSTGEPPASCQPTPTRMVILGDSIAACAVVGGKQSDDCAPKILNDHFAATYGPLTYENLAVGGAVTSDIPQNQLSDIEVGIPGHVVVMIYIGGNDLAGYIFGSDQAAIDGWNDTTGPEVAAAWEEILAFLEDESNFPDGVTLLMNTQYNPFDDCTAPPYFVSETKIELLHAHNDALVERANSRPWGFIADQHPSYLGHGHYVNDQSCPHYDASFDGWMGDLIHPNALGHHHLADVMIEVADTQIYSGCE
jgi:lysophospholipase L1-like esterase